MSYRSERFNDGMRSLDIERVMSDKNRATSDRGLGVKRMIAALDYDSAAEDARETTLRTEREEKLFEAEMRLVEAGKGHLIRVLLLIVENGNDRQSSIRRTSKKTYYRHRNELLKFFSQPQPPTSTSRSDTRVHMDI